MRLLERRICVMAEGVKRSQQEYAEQALLNAQRLREACT